MSHMYDIHQAGSLLTRLSGGEFRLRLSVCACLVQVDRANESTQLCLNPFLPCVLYHGDDCCTLAGRLSSR